jgi:hypothetical protein
MTEYRVGGRGDFNYYRELLFSHAEKDIEGNFTFKGYFLNAILITLIFYQGLSVG